MTDFEFLEAEFIIVMEDLSTSYYQTPMMNREQVQVFFCLYIEAKKQISFYIELLCP